MNSIPMGQPIPQVSETPVPNEELVQSMSILPQVTEQNYKEVRAEMDKAMQKDVDDIQSRKEFTALGGYISACWDSAYQAKEQVQLELYESALQRNGEYTESKLQDIVKLSSSTIFMNITSVKCRAAEAWLRDILSPNNDSIWSISPSPISELKPDVKQYIYKTIVEKTQQDPSLLATYQDQEDMAKFVIGNLYKEMQQSAEEACEKMRTKISDQIVESNWQEALFEVISDVVTFKAGFLKGPVLRREKSLVWEQDTKTGKWKATNGMKIITRYERVSPFDIYPSPESTKISDGYIIQRHRLTRQDLSALIGVAGYDENSVRQVLIEYGKGGLKDWLYQTTLKEKAEGRDTQTNQNLQDTTIDAIEFWGSCQGRLLLEWGMDDKEIPDPDIDYQINAWKIGSYIIKAMINPHPLGRKPYHKTSFEEIPGSFWGRGVPELMADIQAACNATVRALVNNLAISSGPQCAIDTARMDADTNVEEMYPWKIWYYDSDSASWAGAKPIEFFQPDSNSRELMEVYRDFEDKASNYTGIPAFTYGGADAGASSRTATGLSMLMNNASKGIKFVLSNIDKNYIKESIRDLYEFNMLYDEDDSIKGDLVVSAKGALYLVQQEQMQIRRTEFMNMLASNPIYLDIIGEKGILVILREAIKSLEMPIDSIIPSDKEMELRDVYKQKAAALDQIILGIQQLTEGVQTGQIQQDQATQMIIQSVMQMAQQMAPQQPQQGGGKVTQQMNGTQMTSSGRQGDQPNARTLMPNGAPYGGQDVAMFTPTRQ